LMVMDPTFGPVEVVNRVRREFDVPNVVLVSTRVGQTEDPGVWRVTYTFQTNPGLYVPVIFLGVP
jgi:hypothetical protein